MSESDPIHDLSPEDWDEMEAAALNEIERRLRRMRDSPDDRDTIYSSAWRTLMKRRVSGDTDDQKDAQASTPEAIKARLMYHVARKLRSQKDRREKADNQAQEFSSLEARSGKTFEIETEHVPDDEQLMDMILGPCQNLTERQREIARQAMMNYDPKEIAEKLEIGVHTVYRELLVIRAAIDEERTA